MANGSLERRVSKLEKAHGTEEDVGAWLERVTGPAVRELMRGHEAEFEAYARHGGDLTFDALNRIYQHLPEEIKRKGEEARQGAGEARYAAPAGLRQFPESNVRPVSKEHA
ncbi:MAG: hypothetical protein ACR2JB_20065 [Bryobacteraceae bacterium]